MAKFTSLPGFREFYPEACSVRNFIFNRWRRIAQSHNFQEFDGPLLEPLELLTAKSGSEIVSQLFNFTDKGGRDITLRPELTPTLARMVAARANALRRPVKWFSIGENFRYERQQKGRLRSFYQFNADLLGEAGPAADAEIIALLVAVLRGFGLNHNDFVVRLSDRDLWMYFLQGEGYEPEACMRILPIVDKIDREKPERTLAQLGDGGVDDPQQLLEKISRLRMLSSLGEIEAFFRQLESPQALRDQIDLRLQQWQDLLGRLGACGIADYIRVDLGIVRGLAYYTGFVFEAFPASGEGRALAGGGRYDHLVEKLGGPAMPAVGFGMGDVTLRDLLEQCKKLPPMVDKVDVFAAVPDQSALAAALADVTRLREEGLRVDYALKQQNLQKQLKQADAAGAALILIYGGDEMAAGKVGLRDSTTRQQTAVPRTHLHECVRHFFATGELS